MNIKKFFDLACVFLALVTAIATSKPAAQVANLDGTYLVTSDCQDADTSGNLQITKSTTSEANQELITGDYTAPDAPRFGFPSEGFDDATSSKDGLDHTVFTNKGANRHCEGIVFGSGTEQDSIMFVCYGGDKSNVQCTIYLEN